MPKFVIERTLPGAGELTPDELAGIAVRSNAALREVGPDVQWVHTYVTDEKLFCVYNAGNAELVREHARRGGFPCDSVRPVNAIMDPVTGEDAESR